MKQFALTSIALIALVSAFSVQAQDNSYAEVLESQYAPAFPYTGPSSDQFKGANDPMAYSDYLDSQYESDLGASGYDGDVVDIASMEVIEGTIVDPNEPLFVNTYE